MGRRKHSSKMYHMGERWGAKHAQHKHMSEVTRLWNSLRESARTRRKQIARTYASVAELFRREGRG